MSNDCCARGKWLKNGHFFLLPTPKRNEKSEWYGRVLECKNDKLGEKGKGNKICEIICPYSNGTVVLAQTDPSQHLQVSR